MGADKDRWFWTFAVGVALIVVGTIYGSGGRASGSVPQERTAAPAAAPLLARDFTEHAAPVPSQHDVIASVYECRTHGHRVFSDESCGSGAEVRSIKAPSRMDPQDTSILAEPVAEPVRFNRTPAGSPGDNRTLCMQIETERDAINARMRGGYGAGEGEVLRERLRNLSDLWYEERCRHFR